MVQRNAGYIEHGKTLVARIEQEVHKRGFSAADIDASLKALYATDLFADVKIGREGGALVVRDAAGASWSYKVEDDAGIDLSAFRTGDRVKVSIGRATPLNMITAADLLRKGDRVEKVPY